MRFFATGSFHTVIGDFCGISAASVTRVVKETSLAIANLRVEYIFMPRDNDELRKNLTGFYIINQMSAIVGCIDGTHIKISGQGGEHAEMFRNRKQFFSLNIQVIGNYDLKIQNIVARWPGCTHDSYIFDNSNIKNRLEAGEFHPGVLLEMPVTNWKLTCSLHSEIHRQMKKDSSIKLTLEQEIQSNVYLDYLVPLFVFWIKN